MNLQPYPGSPACAPTSSSAQGKPASASDLELLQLIWPTIPPAEFTLWQYRVLIHYITSAFDDIITRYGLPIEQTKEAFTSLVQKQKSARSDALASVETHYAGAKLKDAPRRALQSLLRAWTMLDIQLDGPRYALNIPVWLETEPILNATKRFFDQKAQNEQNASSELPTTIDRDLNAAHLVAEHGISIVPTSNLAEHLSINSNTKRRVLHIFEHKAWVLNHINHPETSPIPPDVAKELMDTFNLLFPQFDDPTKSLLKRLDMNESFHALGSCGRDRSLNWNHYKYWRKDILNLNQVLGEAPQGARQLLRVDNRDKHSLLNVVLFWVSGMVAILTIVSTVCGAWAIKLAIQALDVSIESRDIGLRRVEVAIAQLCADPETASKLPRYCAPQ